MIAKLQINYSDMHKILDAAENLDDTGDHETAKKILLKLSEDLQECLK